MSSYRGSSTGRPNKMVSTSSHSATPHHGSSRPPTSHAPSHGGSYRPGTPYPSSHHSASHSRSPSHSPSSASRAPSYAPSNFAHSRSPSHSSSSASRAPSYAPSTIAPNCPSSTAVVPHSSSHLPSSRSGSTSGSAVPYSGSRHPTNADILNEAFPGGFNYVQFVIPDGTPAGFGPPVIGTTGGYRSGSGTANGYRSGTGSGHRTGPPASYGAGKSPAPSTALVSRNPTQPPAGSKMERYNGGRQSYHRIGPS